MSASVLSSIYDFDREKVPNSNAIYLHNMLEKRNVGVPLAASNTNSNRSFGYFRSNSTNHMDFNMSNRLQIGFESSTPAFMNKENKYRDRAFSDAGERSQQLQEMLQQKPGSQINSTRYKTELCRPFEENGSCKYGEKCQFAHGYHELRNLSRHPKYKTEPCRTFHTIGFCPYGPRCHFIHNADERRAATNNTQARLSQELGPAAEAMATTTCQVVGLLLSLLGLAGCIAATGMDMWSTQDLYDNPVTAVFQYEGLWRSCVQQSSGFTECRPYFTILGLPAMLQAVRALMIVGIVLGVIGILVSIFALKCIRIGSMDDSAKAKMTLTSGILFIISGICAIIGVSVFANMLVTNFWMSTANMYSGMGGMGGMVQTVQTRYTFGAALFVGWVAGGLTLIGGVMMCIACRGLTPDDSNFKAVSYHASGQNVAYRPGGFKASTGFGSNTRNKKIYDGGARTEDDEQSHPTKYDYV